MIDEKVISEKLKYLITMGAKSTQFKIINVYVEIEFGDQAQTRIANYEVQVKFDYEGVLDPDIYTFAHQIQRMSEKVGDLLVQYVITENGKIISNTEGKVSIGEGMVWEMDYKADELHMFDISYRFGYNYID